MFSKLNKKNKTAELDFDKEVREAFIIIFWQSTEISQVFNRKQTRAENLYKLTQVIKEKVILWIIQCK